MMKRKVIETTVTTQTRDQACCPSRNDKTTKVDVSLAHRRKVVFREGPGSTVKSLHDNDIADKARNDLRDYYTRKQQELLRVIESECGIDSLTIQTTQNP